MDTKASLHTSPKGGHITRFLSLFFCKRTLSSVWSQIKSRSTIMCLFGNITVWLPEGPLSTVSDIPLLTHEQQHWKLEMAL